MDSLPLELLDVIACAGGYRGLLCLRRFTDSLNISRRTDFMIGLGYSVKINREGIAWKHNGKYHRTDGPAIEYSDGTTYWHVRGKRHRIDGPAVEYPDGSKYWYVNGVYQHTVDEHVDIFRWAVTGVVD
jgi:hypothetical protein